MVEPLPSLPPPSPRRSKYSSSLLIVCCFVIWTLYISYRKRYVCCVLLSQGVCFQLSSVYMIHVAGMMRWDEFRTLRQLLFDEQNTTKNRRNKLISSEIITFCGPHESIRDMSWQQIALQNIYLFPTSTIHNVFAREIRKSHRWRQETQQRHELRETWGTYMTVKSSQRDVEFICSIATIHCFKKNWLLLLWKYSFTACLSRQAARLSTRTINPVAGKSR